MGLKDLFGKKQADPAPEGTPLAETTHAQIVDAGGIAVATVLCERYSEHEAKPIEHDLLDAAANVLIACRIADGAAEPFPAPLEHDARGLPIAIWV